MNLYDETNDGERIRGNEHHLDAERHRARYRFAAARVKAHRELPGEFQRTPPASRVLDWGCGTGYGTGILREEGLDAVGFEPAMAARMYGRSNYRVPIFDNDNGQSFDAIVALEVLEHVRAYRPREMVHRFLERAPLVIVSFPYKEHTGANKHHRWFELDEMELRDLRRSTVEFYGQALLGPNGGVGAILPLEDARSVPSSRVVNLIAVVRRA